MVYHYAWPATLCRTEATIMVWALMMLKKATSHTTDGVDVVVSVTANEFMNGMTVDYVEIEAGKFEFIFMNPNDPAYVKPSES